MKGKAFKPSLLSLAIAVTLGANTHVFAAEESFAIEEITVYAQKREQSIMEVPIAVSAYGAEQLEKAQIRDASDLQQLAPSLSVNTSSGSSDTSFTIRGIGTSGNNAGLEQSVGVFIDGVYRGRSGAALTDYVDIAGIEILKGPQGTLFGRNTSAGVINVRTAKPEYETSGSLEASLGNDGYKQFKGAVTGALVEDSLAYRLSGTWQEKDGVYDNELLDEDIGDRDRYTLRGQILWDINEDASLRVIADYTDIDEKCCTASPIFYGPATLLGAAATGSPLLPYQAGNSYAGTSGGFADTFDRKLLLNDPHEETLKDWGLSGELNWDFDSMALTVIAAYRESDNSNTIDADFSSLDLISRTNVIDTQETSIEIRLASTGSNTVDWTAGFFYFNQDIDHESPIPFGADLKDHFDILSAAGVDELSGGLTNLVGQGSGLISFLESASGDSYYAEDDYTNSIVDYNAESYAIFGQATWNVSDALSLTLGLRYSEEEKTADYHNDQVNPYSDLTGLQLATMFATHVPTNVAEGMINAIATIPDLGGLDPSLAGVSGAQALAGAAQGIQFGLPYVDTKSKFDDDDLSVALSANYVWNDDLSTYVRFAQGFKSGGLNLDRSAPGQTNGNSATDPNAPIFDSETVDSFEIGFKSRWLDNTLQLNGAVFYQEMDDFQFQEFTGTGFLVQNAAKVVGKGFEVDYLWQPNEHWVLSGGLTLQDIQYKDFDTAPTTLGQSEAGDAFQDLDGEPVIYTSDVSYSGTITYTNNLTDNLLWTLGTSYNYRTEYQTDESNDPLVEQDDSIVVNMFVTIAPEDDSWAIDLWGKNITDEELYMVGFGTTFQAGSYSAYLNAPPTYGITGRYNF